MSKARTLADKASDGRKNKLINGNFDIWQLGPSQTTSGYGSDDRWINGNGGSTKTHTKEAFAIGQTEVPGEPQFFSRTVVSSVAGAANYVTKNQRIESVRTLAGETATLSFWAKTYTSNKNIAIEFFQSFGTGGTPSEINYGISPQLVELTTTWQRYIVTVDIPSIAGKAIGTNGDDHIAVNFWLDGGSNYNGRNANLGQQSGTFDIAQCQLEKGNGATDFEQRSLAEEFELCRRYLRPVYISWGGYIVDAASYIRGLPAGENLAHAMRAAPSISGAFTERVNIVTPLTDISASRWMAKPTTSNADALFRWSGFADAEL